MLYKSAFLLSLRKTFFILYISVGQILPQGERKLMNNLKITIFVSDESNEKSFQGKLYTRYSKEYYLLKADFSLVLGSLVEERHGPFRETPGEKDENDQKTGTPLLCRKA